MRDADIMYDEVEASSARVDARIIGGVIRPASIARECCSPLVMARISGSSSSRP